MIETPSSVSPLLPTPEEPAAVARIRRGNRFYKIAAIWLIGWVGLIVEKIVELDSVESGLHEGLIGGVFVAPFILILTLPMAWLGSRIGSWEKWRRFRLWFTFALPSIYVLTGVGGALKGRYFPQERFQQITGVAFPRDARLERCVFDTGHSPFYDWSCDYELSCSAEETERLIREMKLTGDTATSGTTSKGWIMTESWRQSENPTQEIYIQMQTDVSRTKVRIFCYTT